MVTFTSSRELFSLVLGSVGRFEVAPSTRRGQDSSHTVEYFELSIFYAALIMASHSSARNISAGRYQRA